MLWNLLFLTIPLGVPHFTEFIRANRWVLRLISIVVLFTIGLTVRGIAWLRKTSPDPKLVPPKITAQAVLLIVPAVAFYLAIAAPRFYFIFRPDEWMRDHLPQIVRPGATSGCLTSNVISARTLLLPSPSCSPTVQKPNSC
jgi:hypothetical protein